MQELSTVGISLSEAAAKSPEGQAKSMLGRTPSP